LKFIADLRRGRGLFGGLIGGDAGNMFAHGDATARDRTENEQRQKNEDTNAHG
jgi:hypothetical protein